MFSYNRSERIEIHFNFPVKGLAGITGDRDHLGRVREVYRRMIRGTGLNGCIVHDSFRVAKISHLRVNVGTRADVNEKIELFAQRKKRIQILSFINPSEIKLPAGDFVY